MAKYKIGRHRPYFLTACKINLTDTLCQDANGYQQFVEKFECPGDPYEVREASKSFMSGHSSFSFYCATFLILYLHARLRSINNWNPQRSSSLYWVKYIFRGLKILRPFLQFGIFSLAFYICLTRITDYKHHPGDVLMGAAVGIFFAILILNYLVDLFHRPRSFKVEEFEGCDFDITDGAAKSNSGEMTAIPLESKSEPSLRAKIQRANSDSTKPLTPNSEQDANNMA